MVSSVVTGLITWSLLRWVLIHIRKLKKNLNPKERIGRWTLWGWTLFWEMVYYGTCAWIYNGLADDRKVQSYFEPTEWCNQVWHCLTHKLNTNLFVNWSSQQTANYPLEHGYWNLKFDRGWSVRLWASRQCSTVPHGCVSSYMLWSSTALFQEVGYSQNFGSLCYTNSTLNVPHYSHKLVYCFACTWPEMC